MKLLLTGAMTLFLLLAACGGQGEQASSGTDNTGDVSQVTPDDSTTAVTQPVETPPPPLYPEGTLDPSQVTADIAVSARALNQAYYAWDGKTVVLQGYPHVMYGDSMVVEDELDMDGAPDDNSRLASITFSEVQNVPVSSEDLITVKGTVEYYWTGDINIIDASMVMDAPQADPEMGISPWSYDGETPMVLSKFYDNFTAWIGKEVTVQGYYHSTTTSTTDYGVTVRIDLAESDDTYTKFVACEMDGQISDHSDSMLVADRDGVQIRGTVTGESFDMVGMENCQLLNR